MVVELKRQEMLSDMAKEDELSKLVHFHEQKEQAIVQNQQLTKSMEEYELIFHEELEIKNQLLKTRPLVSDMLLFLNSKGSRPDMTREMIKSMNETVKSLDCVKDQAAQFQETAYITKQPKQF